ncbi:hypothetical protein ACFW61_03185 [Streptomyces microflavus]|uniref:hypothetical protein n=1 Tax=Streptomyces microflavus TaxID=1919 RepID=UPI00369A3FBF
MTTMERGFNDAPKARGAKKKADSRADATYGMPRVTIPAEATTKCTTPRCGTVADSLDEGDPGLAGWTRAGVYGSRDPDRVWCSGQCATIGIALAELRLTATAARHAATAGKATKGQERADA